MNVAEQLRDAAAKGGNLSPFAQARFDEQYEVYQHWLRPQFRTKHPAGDWCERLGMIAVLFPDYLLFVVDRTDPPFCGQIGHMTVTPRMVVNDWDRTARDERIRTKSLRDYAAYEGLLARLIQIPSSWDGRSRLAPGPLPS
ncbi:MAG: hypothetical protein QM589_13585 [Thermomicrobiales bacterium]